MYILSESDISAYLYFGYLPNCGTKFPDLFIDWPRVEENLRFANELSLKLLVEEGVKHLKSVFKKTIAGTSGNHILPLSGGLDSRAILGGLLENVEHHKIQSVTFGSPKTWDFEIGQQIARAADIHCEPIDLTAESWKWDTKKLVEMAKQTVMPVWVFDAYVNSCVAYRFGFEYVYWSGFMGRLDGGYLFKEDSATWDEGVQRFIVKSRFANSLNLTPPNFEPEKYFPATPYTEPSLVCFDNQIHFGIRQQCMLQYTILPNGYEYRTPFLQPEWVSFILGVPRCYRENRWLYKEILKTAFPQLFSLPIKTNYGLPIGASMVSVRARRAVLKAKSIGRRLFPTIYWGIDPNVNYIDFNEGLRKRNDLKNVVYENLQDLKKRNVVPWLDMDAIWLRHQQRQANHADALTLLASLEIYLKAQESQN